MTLLCLVLTRQGSKLSTIAFVWFLIHLGMFWKNLGIFLNQMNQVSITARWLCQLWGTLDLALFSSHSFSLGIEQRCFCLIPYSFRNFLTKFGNFSQSNVPVGNWFNLFYKKTMDSPQFWHFSSPYPLGLKPIRYGALVGHLEGLCLCVVSISVGPFWNYGRCDLGKSSLICMTFWESLTSFQPAFLLFGANFNDWFWIHIVWLTHPLL